jgi:hypothetical protein
MTDLSPATSAILDAYWEAFNAPLEGADGIRQDVLDIADEMEANDR